ncbi:MAG: hypothetical protein AB1630_12325, partial [bacterium]
MKKIILGLLVSFSLYGLEVPDPRKAFVFAPCRFTLGNGGEDEMVKIFDKHHHKYYDPVVKINSHSDLDPEDATLDEFTKALSSPYGIFFVHSHTYLVEAYPPTDDGKEKRDEKFNKYLKEGYTREDIRPVQDDLETPTYYGIRVTSHFIQTRARHKDKSIVFINSCNSFPLLANVFNARNFLGHQDLSNVLENRQDTENLFYNMGGLKDDVDGEKNNDTIHYVFAYANSVNPNLQAQLNGPTMRLYLAPKILKVEVNREVGIDKEEIYTYKYPDLTYPFIDFPYPGDLSGCQKKPAKAGRLRVKIRFSEGMHPAGAKVWLKPPGSIDCVEVTHEFWLKSLYDNDTWDGYIDIPSNQGDKWDGLITVIVKAYDNFTEDDSSQSPDGELDTNGDGIYDGRDLRRGTKDNDDVIYGIETCHQFQIDTTPPKIKKSQILKGDKNNQGNIINYLVVYSKDYETNETIADPFIGEGNLFVELTFDEEMDTGIPLNVSFTGSNHPVSFLSWSNTNTTWYGEFVIPRNSEYQGTHTLSISDATDLAGNTFDSDPTTEQ